MAKSQEALEAHGIKLAAISYDSVGVITDFAEKKGITYPLLSDSGSKMIRAFGILNERDFKPGRFGYGVPYPIVFLIDETGVIRGKFAERRYQDRPPVSELLKALEVHDRGTFVPTSVAPAAPAE